jgi:hypothetical protein
MRGWQMHNGIDYEARWDRDGVHHEVPRTGATELGTEAMPGGDDDDWTR